MKLSKKEVVQINQFKQTHLNYSEKLSQNHIILSAANNADDDAHNKMVCDICRCLLRMKVPFYCEVQLKTGWKPDIIVPTHVKKVIEVFGSETKELFNLKKGHKVPEELRNEIIFVDAKKKFNEKMIL